MVQAYPLNVIVDYIMGMKNLESISDVKELDDRWKNLRDTANDRI